MKPRLLDLFSCAGGAATGYHRAGFDVVGVDIDPMPRYPFEFHQGNAIDYLMDHGHEFDAVHASPPCQKHCSLTKGKGTQDDYECWIEPTRKILKELQKSRGTPWIIENVVGAPLLNPIQLCGSAFGLKVRRHRLFESSFRLWGVGCDHKSQGQPTGVYGTGGRRKNARKGGGGGDPKLANNVAEAREAMGMDYGTREELSQAIPPAYTTFLGKQLLAELTRRNRGGT